MKSFWYIEQFIQCSFTSIFLLRNPSLKAYHYILTNAIYKCHPKAKANGSKCNQFYEITKKICFLQILHFLISQICMKIHFCKYNRIDGVGEEDPRLWGFGSSIINSIINSKMGQIRPCSTNLMMDTPQRQLKTHYNPNQNFRISPYYDPETCTKEVQNL